MSGDMIRSIAWYLALGGTLAFTSAAVAQAPAAPIESAAATPPRAEAQPSAGKPASPAAGSLAPAHTADPAHLTGSLAAFLGADIDTGLPPLPSAKNSTIFGGAIRRIDPVRDQFLLHIYGQRPMKVLFDERTQVYRDGVRIPVRDLKPADHASVQTTLDGDRIFALSVHILTSIPQGRYQGRVLSFDESNGELKLAAAPSPQPFTVYVPASATIVRKGQPAFTEQGSGRWDLRRGALVQVTFASGARALGIANKIVVLAVPGSSFIFSGRITALDEASGSLVLVDPRDQKSYRILFSPSAFSNASMLRIGGRVRITASFDGTDYIATEMNVY